MREREREKEERRKGVGRGQEGEREEKKERERERERVREIDFKELAHVTVKAGKSKIYRKPRKELTLQFNPRLSAGRIPS